MKNLDLRSSVDEKEFSARTIVIRCLLSFWVLLSLRVRFEVGVGLETNGFLADNLSKLANQFYYDGLTDIFVFAAVYMSLSFASERCSRDLWTLLLAFLFAASYIISSVCRDIGNFSFFFANVYQIFLTVFLLAGYTILFGSGLSLIFYFMERRSENGEWSLRRSLLTGALIIFACWLPWLIMNYPCSFNPDSEYQVGQWLGIYPWTAHHPPFSTAVMGLCVSLGSAVWNRNFGCFLYVLLQSVSGAFVFSYVLTALRRIGISRKVWTSLLLFYAATPFWACFAQWFEKDFIYAQAFTLCLAFVLPVLEKRRCKMTDALRIGAVALIAILLRKTGAYELTPALLLLVIWLRKRDRVRMLAAALAAVIFSSCVNNVLYPALNIKGASVAEALNIPFLQTARYVNQFPDEITKEEHDAIDAVLIYDELDKYNPEVSDPIKDNYREDAGALPEYFKVWLQMFFKHPVCYFEAAFMLSYGYLAPVRPALDGYILSNYYPQFSEMGIYRVFGDFPTRVFDSLRQMFIGFPVVNILCMAGFYTWVLMACFVQILRKKQYSALLAFVPGIMNVLICIASPLCASTRYELPTIACAPIFFGLALIISQGRFRQQSGAIE